MKDPNSRLRALPAVTALLAHDDATRLMKTRPRERVVAALRKALDVARRETMNGAAAPDAASIVKSAETDLARADRPGLRRVVNATGIVLHTGLGRAVLPKAAVEALVAETSGYCLLAVDAETNERGRRERFSEEILVELTGCEAATVVNNNAAAVMLVLNTLAAGKEVIVSRGQLVEIGGAFRMPDVMARAGCRMVEVGCTNRTHLKDYRSAITENTAAIIRVHPSNYRVQGFVGEPSIEELVALGRERGLPVIDDLGSGALVKLDAAFDEPLVADSLAAGADVVTCSADKLIGGPQGGVILGKKAIVERCDDNQLARALRVGKLDLVALEATLRLFRDKDALLADHPTSRMLTEPVDVIAARAKKLAAAIKKAAPSLDPRVEDSASYAGSGALPVREISTKCVVLDPSGFGKVGGVTAAEAAKRLRCGDPSLFVRVHADRLFLDPRTIQPGEDAMVLDALRALAAKK
jgi:L-seryl-tRNA(Ser) seleniumtransferase